MWGRCLEICRAHGFRRIEAANWVMLGMMLLMEMKFAEALRLGRGAVDLAEQIGNRRAAMIGYQGLAFVHVDLAQWGLAVEANSVALDIARSLGARRFIAESLMIQAQCEFGAGDPRARQSIREANEIASETPSYLLPFGLALEAMITDNADERAAALAEGERVLREGAVSHNFLLFNRYAIEACLAAKDWTNANRYATALEQSFAVEPFPMADFLVARTRAIVAGNTGQNAEDELKRLVAEANRISWRAVVPALDAALAKR